MREAAAAARLQAKADVVIDADGGHRRGAVRRDDHAQAVFEFGAFQGNVQWFQNRSFKMALPIVSLIVSLRVDFYRARDPAPSWRRDGAVI